MPSQIRIVFLVIGRRHQNADVAPEYLGCLMAEQSFRCRIERFDAAVRIDDDNPIHGGVDD
jgi:hypothetical protein